MQTYGYRRIKKALLLKHGVVMNEKKILRIMRKYGLMARYVTKCKKPHYRRIEEKNYTVYMHTSPSGKRYIGITRQNPPEKRWRNGNAYKGSKHFYRAIQKYGFENFEHEILFTELTKEEIDKLKMNNNSNNN